MRKNSVQLIVTLLLLFLTPLLLEATSGRYRCMWRTDPATSIVIGWDQISGDAPVIYYDVIDFGRQVTAYRKNQQPDRIIVAKGMNNHFVRLSNLQPNTVYYFVIKDSDGVSDRMSFKTAPATPNERLSIIAGGDSRNHREARRDANRLVSKLRPHMVVFDGDMTGGDTNQEWKDWFDDWQETMGSDGRLFPIIPARGNHESSNASITELFDVSSNNVYYGLTFGGNLFRLYTLNSLIAPGGSQKIWLEGDLKANAGRVTWKMAQYHQSIRPHTRRKGEKDELLLNWATLFHKYGVDLVMESDAHVVKTTYPIRPSREAGSDEGFIRDDENGTVYIGEGCWGAPLRDADDPKSWTRATGSFNQFKWIFVDQEKIEVRTIRTDGARSVAEVRDRDIFEPPVGLVIWNPPSGDVLTIRNKNYQPSAPVAHNSAQQNTDSYSGRDKLPGEQASAKSENNDSRVEQSEEKPVATEKPNPDDPSDWSMFPKVIPDAKGEVVLKYHLRQGGSVSMQLISPKWQKITELNFDKQPSGNNVKTINMSRVPKGRYLLVIKGPGGIARRYVVLRR
jgi:hypothetical protein